MALRRAGRQRHGLVIAPLPGYAPQLNPVELHVNAVDALNSVHATFSAYRHHSTAPQHRPQMPRITLDREPFALRSTRNRLRTAVRRGASWTAAYRRQLTVAAVARPVRGGVGALGVLAAARSGGCSPRRRLPRGASSRSRGVGRCRRGRPGQQARHGVGRRCPAGGVHPSGLGVRDPAVQPSGVWSPGVVVQRVRRSAVCCPPVQRPAVCCPSRAVSSRLVSAPRPSGRVRLLPTLRRRR